MQKRKTTQFQVFAMYNLYIFTVTNAFYLGSIIHYSRYSTPAAMLIGGGLSLLFIYPVHRLAASRPDKSIAIFGKEIIGKVPHAILMLLVASTNILLSAINLRDLQDFLRQIYLQGTPSWTIALLYGVCIIYVTRSGGEVIFRAAIGIFVFSILTTILMPIVVSNELSVQMLPAFITHLDSKQIWGGVRCSLAIFGEFSFLYLFFPYIYKPEKMYRTIIYTTISSLIVIMSHLLPVLMTMGPYLSANLVYPDLDLIRSIRTGTLIETMDPILIVTWLSSLFIKFGFMIFVAAFCIARIFSFKDEKSLALSFTSFICILSLFIVNSRIETIYIMNSSLLEFLYFGEFLVPWTYFVVSLFKSRKKKKRETT